MRTATTALGLSLLACQGSPVGASPDAGNDATTNDAASSFSLVYEDPGDPEDGLNAIWAAGPDEIVAVGNDRQIVSFDGIEWNALVKTSGAHLFGIWGGSASDVVTVGLYSSGSAPAAFYYNGTQWLVGGPFPPGVTPLTDAWGIETQRYFTGLAGHIYQDDPIEHPTDRYHTAVITGGCPDVSDPAPNLNAIDGSDLENLLAVGDSGLMAHRDGTGWARFCAPDTSVNYASVTLIPGTKEFYIGSNYFGLLKWIDRKSPLLQIHEDRELPNAEQSSLHAIWAASSASVIAVGDGGAILYYDGGPDGARPVPSPTTEPLYGVVGVGERTLYVCGKGNRIYKGELPDG